MTDAEPETNRGMQWIRARFADVLGLTPEALEWERHSIGGLLQIPVGDEKHYIAFEHAQIASAGDDKQQKDLHKWIADHAKEAQRSPASRETPYICPVRTDMP